MRNLLTMFAATGAVVLLAGCGAAATQSSAPNASNSLGSASTATPVPSLPPTEPPTAAPTPIPGIGATYTISDGSGNSVDITLTKIQDPEPSSLGDNAPAGAHYVAAFFTIKGDSGIFQSDVNNDAGAVDSNGTTYQADIADVACNNNFTSSGEYDLTPGHSVSGCVPFEILDGLHLTQVTWDASSGNGATWTIG